jgi:hypothetical protein
VGEFSNIFLCLVKLFSVTLGKVWSFLLLLVFERVEVTSWRYEIAVVLITEKVCLVSAVTYSVKILEQHQKAVPRDEPYTRLRMCGRLSVDNDRETIELAIVLLENRDDLANRGLAF